MGAVERNAGRLAMVTGGWRGIGRAVAERLADGQAVIAEFDLDVLDRILCTNVGGTFVVNQLAARRVRAGGAIVNFSSSVEKIAPARPSSFAPPGVLAPAHCRPDAHSRSRTRVPERRPNHEAGVARMIREDRP